jgi:NAD-dependent deacetylase
LDEVATALRDARHVAVLTGAGVSAESGIPTFRDALTGLWANFRPEELATPEAFERNPRLVWEWYAMRREMVGRAQPNPAHLALAQLESLVPRLTLITQNVDGLHERAGSTRVIELHGNITRVKCSREGTVQSTWSDVDEPPPKCNECGARLRPDVVWFGEMLPPKALHEAQTAAEECDLFLSIGTSNVVEPAASLPWIAAQAGAQVIVVNPDMNGQRRGHRIQHFLGKAGEILPLLLETAFGPPPA